MGIAWRRAAIFSKTRSQTGMTLIEIMVVVMIIGLVMAAVGFAVFRWFKSAQKKTARTGVNTVVKAMWKWAHDDNERECPESLSVLVPEYVVSKRTIRDPWGKPLKHRCIEDRFCVWSSGPNKRDENGGGDDIKSEGCTSPSASP